MDILYLGHAGFLVETPDCIIVMDPWLSAEGAFDSSWYQLPRNHHLAPVVRDTLENTAKPGYVYVSHEHRDHFDLAFLSTLPSNVTYLTPVYRRTALADSLGKLPSRGVVTLPDGGRFTAGRTTAQFFVEDGELDRDSAILVADSAHSLPQPERREHLRPVAGHPAQPDRGSTFSPASSPGQAGTPLATTFLRTRSVGSPARRSPPNSGRSPTSSGRSTRVSTSRRPARPPSSTPTCST